MSSTAPSEAPQQDQDGDRPADGAAAEQPGFSSRGKARRRARFLRRARELAYRDLGGLVYNLHRFGQRNDTLVLGKLGTLSHIDTELRTIETALSERRPVTVLREAGITACPRCAAIHGSEDRYCPNCGLPMARNVDLPIAGAPAGAPEPPTPGASPGPQHGYAPPPAAPSTAQYQAVPTAAHPTAAHPTAVQPPGAVPTAAVPAGAVPTPPAAQPGAPPPVAQTPPAGEGRSPFPPGAGQAPQAPSAAAEEATEILHPRSPGP